MRVIAASACLALLSLFARPAAAASIFIDFEDPALVAAGDFGLGVPLSGFTDSATGLLLTFANAAVFQSDISLVAEEFPPRSGFNVLGDDGGSLTISLPTLAVGVSGFFTYTTQLTLTVFRSGVEVGSAQSSGFENFISAGGDGNEEIAFSGTEFDQVQIVGDPTALSFFVDDLTIDLQDSQTPAPVPEPVTVEVPAAPDEETSE